MLIRSASTANADDAIACAAIYAPYVADTVISFELVPPNASTMRERIETAVQTHAWLVVEIDATVVGYAYAHPFASRPAYRWSCESSIYLAASHRQAGIGSQLYSALLERLTERGFRTVLAGLTLPNAASERLHRSAGFEPVGVYRRVGWKDGAWRDVAWYQRDLAIGDDPPAEPR